MWKFHSSVADSPSGYANAPKEQYSYALLDSGSQASLMLENFADEIGLEGSKEVLTLGTINSKDKPKLSRRVSFAVRATGDDNDGSQFPVSEA